MIKEKALKLINVKSIVTILLTVLFMYLAIKGDIPREVTHIYTTVISFYFGTQLDKEKKKGEQSNEQNNDI